MLIEFLYGFFRIIKDEDLSLNVIVSILYQNDKLKF